MTPAPAAYLFSASEARKALNIVGGSPSAYLSRNSSASPPWSLLLRPHVRLHLFASEGITPEARYSGGFYAFLYIDAFFIDWAAVKAFCDD